MAGGLLDGAVDDGVRELLASLARLDGLLVAFSGGTDSAFVLAAAVRALGPDRVVAATAVSPSLPASARSHPSPAPRDQAGWRRS